MRNIFDLKRKTAIVTGASSGLGVQFAKALANQGADIVIAARRTGELELVKSEIEQLGVRCLAVTCDLSKTDDIVAMVAAAKDFFGRIDILVNNAGVGEAYPAESQTDEQWYSIVNINLNSAYFVYREVGKVMIEQQYGKIVIIGSIH